MHLNKDHADIRLFINVCYKYNLESRSSYNLWLFESATEDEAKFVHGRRETAQSLSQRSNKVTLLTGMQVHQVSHSPPSAVRLQSLSAQSSLQ